MTDPTTIQSLMIINILKKPAQKNILIYLDNRDNPDNIQILYTLPKEKSTENYHRIYLKTDTQNKNTFGHNKNDAVLFLPDKSVKELIPIIDPYGGYELAIYNINKSIPLPDCSLLLSNLYPDIHAINIYIYD